MKRLGIILFHLMVISILLIPWILPGEVTHQYLGEHIIRSDGKVMRTINYDGDDICSVTYRVKIKRTDGSIYEKDLTVDTHSREANTFFEKQLINNKKVYYPNINCTVFFFRAFSVVIIIALMIRDFILFSEEEMDCTCRCTFSEICLHSRSCHKILMTDDFIIRRLWISTKPFILRFFGYD